MLDVSGSQQRVKVRMNNACSWIIATAALLSACGDSSAGPQGCSVETKSGGWTFLGLENQRITALAETPWGLYAGTADSGVFHLSDATWQPLGLDHVSSILFVPGPTDRLLVGVYPFSDEQTDAAVFATEDRGATWLPWDGGLAARRGSRGWAYSLGMNADRPDRLFMGYFDQIVRSEDGGRTWAFVQGDESQIGGGQIRAIAVAASAQGRVWAGGGTSFFTAVIWRTADSGTSWEFVDPTPRFENAVQALMVDPENSNRVWAGLAGVSGGVMRSDDAGKTWTYRLRPRHNGGVFALARVHATLYAVARENVRLPPSGQGPSWSDLGLYRSCDDGATWDTLPVPPGIGGGQAITIDGEGRLVIGTLLGSGGAGVWRFSGP